MRAPITLAISLLASSANAVTTGNQIHGMCQSDRTAVLAYLAGWMDRQSLDVGIANSLPDKLIKEGRQPPDLSVLMAFTGAICIPPNVERNQIVDLVCKALADHPENRNKGMNAIILPALHDAWPCG